MNELDLFDNNYETSDFSGRRNYSKIIGTASEISNMLGTLDIDSRIEAINQIKLILHDASPLKNEPVDCVIWVKKDIVYSNDYNPNAVAPPEMELLHTSISEDGYTQPIVTMAFDGRHEVVDGFHRNRVGKEYPDITTRVHGYLPVVCINEGREDKADRMAATIRHNRARGKHKVSSMSDIVLELKKRNWSDAKISKQLGMDSDEVLRLAQITGLAEMFKDQDFSQAWEAEVFEDENIIKDI